MEYSITERERERETRTRARATADSREWATADSRECLTQIDGGEYYALFADDFALLDQHGLFHPIIDLLPGYTSII